MMELEEGERFVEATLEYEDGRTERRIIAVRCDDKGFIVSARIGDMPPRSTVYVPVRVD